MQEKLPVAMHPEKLPVAGSVGGSFSVSTILLFIVEKRNAK